MQLPINEKERALVQEAFRALKGNNAFEIIASWLKSELQRLDEGNRYVGQENKISGAQVLSDFLKEKAACQASETDRNNANSDAESKSAQPLV